MCHVRKVKLVQKSWSDWALGRVFLRECVYPATLGVPCLQSVSSFSFGAFVQFILERSPGFSFQLVCSLQALLSQTLRRLLNILEKGFQVVLNVFHQPFAQISISFNNSFTLYFLVKSQMREMRNELGFLSWRGEK